jgi:aspartate/methionine/tyrosine aminotransferase
MFSRRVPNDRRPNRLAAALAEVRASGRPLIDLTCSNPTRVGIRYPDTLLAPLADARALVYAPDPRGLPEARQAVAEIYARRGVRIPPERLLLTASTSEAYSLLFKLLCDAGRAAVLTPAPSYPLFDHLTRLDGVAERRYALDYHGTWDIDLDGLDGTWTDDTRALLVVSPNNPTGSTLSRHESDELVSRCASRGCALIVDEVFCDYPLGSSILADPEAFSRDRCLLFRLGGLSKTAGLPQVKLGWIAVSGPDSLVDEALDRLDLIADTYLSVSTPVQTAARALLDGSRGVREQIHQRVRHNYRTLREVLADTDTGATLLAADAGWSAVLRVPATRSEEAMALDLLTRDGIVVHPGFFFDFPHEAFLVVSLLPQPAEFARGIRTLLERVHAA